MNIICRFIKRSGQLAAVCVIQRATHWKMASNVEHALLATLRGNNRRRVTWQTIIEPFILFKHLRAGDLILKALQFHAIKTNTNDYPTFIYPQHLFSNTQPITYNNKQWTPFQDTLQPRKSSRRAADQVRYYIIMMLQLCVCVCWGWC